MATNAPRRLTPREVRADARRALAAAGAASGMPSTAPVLTATRSSPGRPGSAQSRPGSAQARRPSSRGSLEPVDKRRLSDTGLDVASGSVSVDSVESSTEGFIYHHHSAHLAGRDSSHDAIARQLPPSAYPSSSSTSGRPPAGQLRIGQGNSTPQSPPLRTPGSRNSGARGSGFSVQRKHSLQHHPGRRPGANGNGSSSSSGSSGGSGSGSGGGGGGGGGKKSQPPSRPVPSLDKNAAAMRRAGGGRSGTTPIGNGPPNMFARPRSAAAATPLGARNASNPFATGAAPASSTPPAPLGSKNASNPFAKQAPTPIDPRVPAALPLGARNSSNPFASNAATPYGTPTISHHDTHTPASDRNGTPQSTRSPGLPPKKPNRAAAAASAAASAAGGTGTPIGTANAANPFSTKARQQRHSNSSQGSAVSDIPMTPGSEASALSQGKSMLVGALGDTMSSTISPRTDAHHSAWRTVAGPSLAASGGAAAGGGGGGATAAGGGGGGSGGGGAGGGAGVSRTLSSRMMVLADDSSESGSRRTNGSTRDQVYQARPRPEHMDDSLADSGRSLLKSTLSSVPIDWKRGSSIGAGTFGTVYRGLNVATGELFAVKSISAAGPDGDISDSLIALEKEVNVMRYMERHDNIVQYLGTEREGRNLYVFLEYVPGGSIRSMLHEFGVLEEPLVAVYTRQILLGLKHLHDQNIVHRDIKGANVLVNEMGVCKLADFGASKQLDGSQTRRLDMSLRAIRGTVPYMAPEVIQQKRTGTPADIWSLGATVVEMASGSPPYSEFSNNLATMFHIATSGNAPKVPDTLSDTAKDFLSLCFRINPATRATAEQLLTHPFVNNAAVMSSTQSRHVRAGLPTRFNKTAGSAATSVATAS